MREMQERRPLTERDPLEGVAINGGLETQYKTTFPLNARLEEYEIRAKPKRKDLYDLDYAPYDAEEKLLLDLDIGDDKVLVDIGTGDGAWLAMSGFTHWGRRIGVEPNGVRDASSDLAGHLSPELLMRSILKMKKTDQNGSFIEHAAAVANGHGSHEERDDLQRLILPQFEIVEGTAAATGLEDHIADIVTVKRVLQHVEDRPQVYAEIKRIMAPNGMCAIVATGQRNKAWTRFFENEIATWLSLETRRKLQTGEINSGSRTQAPPNMNHSFTTEKAKVELPEHFNYVYCAEIKYKMVVDDDFKIAALINSLRSRRDQFHDASGRIPTLEEFNAAIEAAIVPMICAKIEEGKPYEDHAEHSVLVCMNRKWKHRPVEYKRLKPNK